MRAGFPQGKPGKQDAKRIATFAYHLLRRRKRLIKKNKKAEFLLGVPLSVFFCQFAKLSRQNLCQNRQRGVYYMLMNLCGLTEGSIINGRMLSAKLK